MKLLPIVPRWKVVVGGWVTSLVAFGATLPLGGVVEWITLGLAAGVAGLTGVLHFRRMRFLRAMERLPALEVEIDGPPLSAIRPAGGRDINSVRKQIRERYKKPTAAQKLAVLEGGVGIVARHESNMGKRENR